MAALQQARATVVMLQARAMAVMLQARAMAALRQARATAVIQLTRAVAVLRETHLLGGAMNAGGAATALTRTDLHAVSRPCRSHLEATDLTAPWSAKFANIARDLSWKCR